VPHVVVIAIGVGLVFVGVAALANWRGFADGLAAYGRRQRDQRGVWAGPGATTTPQARWVGLGALAVGIVWLAAGIATMK